MPIKDISDIRRITRCGYLRLGVKVPNRGGNGEHPEKTDHFVSDFVDKEITKVFHERYGDKPKRITIAFASDDPEKCFPQWYKCYGSSTGLKCKGDGEAAQRLVDGDMKEVDCPTPDGCEFGKKNGCKRMASLQFFIQGLPVLQVAQINTTSFNSIVNVNSGLELLRMARGGGPIAGVWVDLVLKPQQAQASGKKVNIYVLEIVIPYGLDDIKKLTCALPEAKGLPAPSEARDPYLTPGPTDDVAETVDPETGEIVDVKAAEPEPPALIDDPDVQAAFRDSSFTEVKINALLTSADACNWSKEQLLENIAAGANGNGKPTVKAEVVDTESTGQTFF